MRTENLLVVVIALALCAIALNATGSDWYVDAINGSDSTGDGTEGNPWKTLTYATSQTNQTGTEEDPCVMYVAPGVYSPSTNGETFPIEFKHAAITTVRCGEFRGSGSDVTIIDAEGTYRVLDISLNNGTVSDLTITGGGHPTKDLGGGIRAYGSWGVIKIERCVIRDNSRGRGLSAVNHPSSYEITDCQFINNNGSSTQSGAGISIGYDITMTMTNCLIDNNRVLGDRVGGGLCIAADTHVTLINCTIVNNHKHGVYMSEWRTVVRLYNCILWDNYDDLHRDEGGDGQLIIRHCNISDGDGLGENGNISQDPLFVTGAKGDYYLSHAGVNSKKKEAKSR